MSIDLSTQYLGIPLSSPLVVSACPLTSNPDSMAALQEAGAAAVVLPSLFEEQIQHVELELARLYDNQIDMAAESLSYFPELNAYNSGPDNYLDLIRKAKEATSIPIIASLNGCSQGGWLRYAHLIELAGADALELNIYTIPVESIQSSGDVDQMYCDLVAALRQELTIPLAVKMGPYFSSIPSLAKGLIAKGADGLVLFNRYLAPDIDLRALEFKPALELSHSDELRLALRWIAILRDQVTASLAATGGVHQVEDVVKALMVGADVTMLASTLLQRGIGHLRHLKSELFSWLEKHEYQSVRQLQGSMSFKHCINPEGLLRANYMRALTSYSKED
jgi:dihydroorotate dehydrogenase (fumarate)